MNRYLKYLLIAPPLLICAAAVCLSHANAKQKLLEIPAAAESDQIRWLASQGLQGTQISAESVIVPHEFTGQYADYAALQEQQRLPLSAHAGSRATCITYAIADSDPPMYAELLTADGILIGAQCYIPEKSMTLTMQGKPFTAPAQAAENKT